MRKWEGWAAGVKEWAAEEAAAPGNDGGGGDDDGGGGDLDSAWELACVKVTHLERGCVSFFEHADAGGGGPPPSLPPPPTVTALPALDLPAPTATYRLSLLTLDQPNADAAGTATVRIGGPGVRRCRLTSG